MNKVESFDKKNPFNGWMLLKKLMQALSKLVGARDLRPLWSPPVSLNLVSSIPLIETDGS